MRERPAGAELLQVAASTLRNQILPSLADDQKYLGLMVLNAIAIAERQLVLDERPAEAEHEALTRLLDIAPAKSGDARRDVAELERELVRRIRSGALDNDEAGQRALWDITVARARESAPRSLESKE